MISVIVPVYNVEKYLDKCIHSILKQTYKDFELILVDDGSTDNSGKKCDEYAKQDQRIIVIHKKNGGPSIARNEASFRARGEYISFIDSDDYVTSDYLQVLIQWLTEFDADICAVKMREITEKDVPEERQKRYVPCQMTGRDALLNVLYQKDLDTTPCGMLFKKEIVLANPFPAGRFHEDDFTMFKYFQQAKKVGLLKCEKYYYVQHETSIMHQKTQDILNDEIEASDNLVDYFSTKDKDLYRAAKSKKFSNYCQLLIENPNYKEINPENYIKICTYLKRNRFSVMFNPHTRMKNKIAGLILCFGVKALITVACMIESRKERDQ